MKQLLEFILKGVLGEEKFEVIETEEAGRFLYTVKVDPANIGLIIGKGGKTISTLRQILKVRATLEKKGVNIEVLEA